MNSSPLPRVAMLSSGRRVLGGAVRARATLRAGGLERVCRGAGAIPLLRGGASASNFGKDFSALKRGVFG